MGRRYKAILSYLKEPFRCMDLKIGPPDIPIGEFDRYIIATPTSTHLGWVMELDHYEKPILCEKPLSKDMGEVMQILGCKSPLTMQMQYLQLVGPNDVGHSSYNYFHHGSDGLVWDCFQIVALAAGSASLAETSPIWQCTINGRQLQRQTMDSAYVNYVSRWLRGETITSRPTLQLWHERVKRFEDGWNSIRLA